MYVSKLARGLEGDGLLERADDPSDTRAVRLALTERGEETVRAARLVVVGIDEWLLEPLGGRDSDRSRRLTEDLLALVRRLDEVRLR